MAKKRPNLYCLMGLPGCGKTTWLMNFFKTAKSYTKWISSDRLIMEWAKRDGIQTYDEAHDRYSDTEIIKELRNRAWSAIRHHQDVVIDQTNLTRMMRDSKLSMYPKNYKRIGVWFKGDPEFIRQRTFNPDRLRQGKNIPQEVWEQMVEAFQPPQDGEFDELIIVEVK